MNKNKKLKGAFWRARPFMRPAFATELGNLSKHWKNTFAKG